MSAAFAIAILVIKELYRRKDFYVLFVLTAVLTLMMGSINFFNDAKIAEHLKEFCLVLIWIAALVISITTTARQIPAERENRTIFPLLAKPVSRGQVLFGKFLGCWLATGVALFVFYALFGLISASRESHLPLGSYAQALWLHWVMLAIVIALVLLGSLVFSAVSANATICFVIVLTVLVLGDVLNQFALRRPEPMQSIIYGIYYIIPHLEWFKLTDRIIYNWEAISWLDCILATLYAAVYVVLLLFAAWAVFRRKPLNT